MRIFDRLFGALVALALALVTAAADPMTVTGWTQIAIGAVVVNPQSDGGVWLADSASAPTGMTGAIWVQRGEIATIPPPVSKWWAAPHTGSSATIGVATAVGTQAGMGYSASGLTAVAGVLSATGNSAAFTPLAGRSFNISLWGAFSAGCALKRSFDSANWLKITAAGSQFMSFTGPASEQWQESEVGVQYRLECTVASGAVSYRISQ